MESTNTNQQFWSPESPVAQPHFDDEATLLSARPVVPIEKIAVKTGFPPPWVLGFALAGALVLGVAATAIYFSQFRTTGPQPVSSVDTLSSGAEGVGSKPIVNDPVTTDATVDSNTTTAAKAPVSDSLTTRPLKSSDTVSTKPAFRRVTGAPGRSSESEHETREERRAAKREVKEQRRANHERRESKQSDAVLRIRDIFEGPSRP